MYTRFCSINTSRHFGLLILVIERKCFVMKMFVLSLVLVDLVFSPTLAEEKKLPTLKALSTTT